MLETICDVMSHSYKLGLISTRDGNASIRHRDRDHFYVTPSGVRKQNLQYTHFIKMSTQQTAGLLDPVRHQYTPESVGLDPTGELPLHYGLQKTIPTDVRVVLHLHPTYTVAAMHRGIDLSNLCKDFPELGRYSKVAATVGDVPPVSQELALKCHVNLGLQEDGSTYFDIVGIKGHGVVAIAETPWQAFEHIERLEHICKIVLVSGKPMRRGLE